MAFRTVTHEEAYHRAYASSILQEASRNPYGGDDAAVVDEEGVVAYDHTPVDPSRTRNQSGEELVDCHLPHPSMSEGQMMEAGEAASGEVPVVLPCTAGHN